MQKLARVAFSTSNVHNCARICPGPSVPLHCGTLPNAKLLKKYLKGAAEMKLGVAVKGCDAMGFYELAKRPHPPPDNIILIGVNCQRFGQPGPHP